MTEIDWAMLFQYASLDKRRKAVTTRLLCAIHDCADNTSAAFSVSLGAEARRALYDYQKRFRIVAKTVTSSERTRALEPISAVEQFEHERSATRRD